MKARCNFIVLLLGFLAACTRPSQVPELEVAEQSRSIEGPSQKLVAVDSLMWRQPDSALVLLLPWFDSVAVPVEYDLHYAHLLLSELLYKNYYEQTNRAELLQSEAYFDSISLIINDSPHILWSHCGPSFRECGTQSPQTKDNLAFLSARAHYMDGVGHYERDSLVPACREYMKALEIMEDRFEEKELVFYKANFMAMIYTRLTEVFSSLYLHEQAIYYGERSLRYYKECHASARQIANVLDEIGMHYEMMETLDSADRYFKKAMGFLQDTCNLTYRDLSSHIVYLSYKKGEDPVALLKTMRDLLDLSESQKEFYSRYLTIGDIYYHEGILDSAFFVLDKVFVESNSIASKKQAAEWLVDICKAEGRDSEILEYASFLAPFATQDEYNGAIKSQCAELYNAFRQKEMTFHHQVLARRNKKLTIIVVGGLFFALFVLLIIYLKRKHHFKAQLEAESYTHQVQQAALSSRLRQSNQKVRELKEQMRKQDAVSFTRRGDVSATFNEEPVCRLIMERVNVGNFMSQMDCTIYKEYALSKEQLMDLRKAADLHFNDFTTRLCKAFPELTNSDLDYCCLYLLGLTDADISALMQRAYNTINERSGKLKRVIGVEKTLSGALISFANESQNGDCQDVF